MSASRIDDGVERPAGQGPLDYRCPVKRCGYISVGWTTENEVQEVAMRHEKEHRTGVVTTFEVDIMEGELVSVESSPTEAQAEQYMPEIVEPTGDEE